MEITILQWLSLQKVLKDLSKDWELNITSKMNVVSIMEDLTVALKPFFTVRNEIIEKNKSKDEDGKDSVDIEKVNKELVDAVKENIKLGSDEFKLTTSEEDKILTAEMIWLLKEIYWDKFILETK